MTDSRKGAAKASKKKAPKGALKKRSDEDAKLAEALFAHASEYQGSMRAMVKGLQKFGAAPAMAVLTGLTNLCKSRELHDSMSGDKVFRSYETVRVKLSALRELAVEAEKADDAEALAEHEAAAARYASAHAACAAMQAWRAIGGETKHQAVIRNKIIQALGSLSAD